MIGKTDFPLSFGEWLKSRRKELDLIPGGVYFVSLASLNAPEFIVPAIAKVLGPSFSGTADPQEQLLNQLTVRSRQALLLVLDNLEHLLFLPSEQSGKDKTTDNLDFLTSRMRDVPERHRSLKAVFEHSWKLLTAEERGV